MLEMALATVEGVGIELGTMWLVTGRSTGRVEGRNN